ncbi:MAG: hypothetical protein M3R15_01695, partial [Acidobacteriota bacterium]|nr:hypothetical protein [Acidobacteriota bacterium]
MSFSSFNINRLLHSQLTSTDMKAVPRSLKNILAAGILLCLMLCSLAPGRERGSNGVKPTISQTPEKAG